MKKLFTSAVFICTFFIACNNNNNAQNPQTSKEVVKEDTSDNKPESEKKISKRDYSITKENAYNDLFLDSMTVEKFITQKKLPDKISRRIRSFYNTRNYQFAWFSTNGLTEQALGFWNLHNYATYSGDTSLRDDKLQRKMDDLVATGDSTISG